MNDDKPYIDEWHLKSELNIRIVWDVLLARWHWFALSVFICLMLAFVFGGIIGVLLLASGIKQRKDPIPFGPFLCIGAYIALLFSPYLIYFYWNLFV